MCFRYRHLGVTDSKAPPVSLKVAKLGINWGTFQYIECELLLLSFAVCVYMYEYTMIICLL